MRRCTAFETSTSTLILSQDFRGRIMTAFHHSFNEVYRMEPGSAPAGIPQGAQGFPDGTGSTGIRDHCYKDREPYEVLSTRLAVPMKEVLRLKMVESMVEVYYNSGQFQHTLEVSGAAVRGSVCLSMRSWEHFMRKKATARSHIHGCADMRSCWNFCREETDLDADVSRHQHTCSMICISRERLKKAAGSLQSDPETVSRQCCLDIPERNIRVSKTAHIEAIPEMAQAVSVRL